MKRILLPLLLVSALATSFGTTLAASPSHGVSPEWGPEYSVNNSSGPANGVVGRGLAVDSTGRIHAVWTDRSDGGTSAYYGYSDDNGQTWTDGTDFSLSKLPSFSANIAVGPDDTVHVAWLDRVDGATRLYHSRSLDGGITWDDPKAISTEVDLDVHEISISVDLNNRVHIAWHVGDPESDSEIAQVYYARSLDGGQSFEEPLRLNTDTNADAGFPRFSVQGTDGELVAVSWRDKRAGNWDIYIAVSTDAGATFDEYFVYAAPRDREDFDPEVVVDPNGVLHLAYFTNQLGGSVIHYHTSTDQGQTWSDPALLSESGIFSRFPFWVPDYENDTIWLFWKDERDLGSDNCSGPSRCADVVVRYTKDYGVTWSEMEFVTDLGEVEVKLPSPAVGPDGIVYVIWSDPRDGLENESIYIKSRLTTP